MKNRIKELRNEKHLTQKELGQKIKLAVSTISGYETGARNPDDEMWDKLAKALKVTVPYLQGFDADGKEKPCDYCDFSKRDRATYPLYDRSGKFVGFVYLNNDRTITVDLMRLGNTKTKEQVNGCPNCRRDLRNEEK